MVSQEINQTSTVHDKESALDEYGRCCQDLTLAEKKLGSLQSGHPHHDIKSAEAALQSAKAYAQDAWEVVVSYLR